MLAILTLINEVINTGGPLAILGIKAFKELAAEKGMTTAQLLTHAKRLHDIDTTKIAVLLDETAS